MLCNKCYQCISSRIFSAHSLDRHRLRPESVQGFRLQDCAQAKPGVLREEQRLRHRVLDLRRPGMAANLRLRHAVTRAIRCLPRLA
jgi:hypothetical protein